MTAEVHLLQNNTHGTNTDETSTESHFVAACEMGYLSEASARPAKTGEFWPQMLI